MSTDKTNTFSTINKYQVQSSIENTHLAIVRKGNNEKYKY